MSLRKATRRPLVGIAAILALAASTGIGAGLVKDFVSEKRFAADLEKVIAVGDMDRAAEDFHAKIDRIRGFLNDHSRHLVDDEFWAMHSAPNTGPYLRKIIAHAEGRSNERAHMECSTRSHLFGRILTALGYQVRTVAMFGTGRPERPYSHVVIDVKNPQTGVWETQDPDGDIYWKSASTGERLSIAEAGDDLDAVIPCNASSCGWDLRGRDGQWIKRYRKRLDILSITDKDADIRYGLYTSRANLDAALTLNGKTGVFCEIEAKRCGDGFVKITEQAKLAKALGQE
ncbi:hypothetical protein V6C03_07045 [Methyloligella sp. 2.7D]|uniref:hypothetical protein n=1 Tax=unclassified Methyloligella TaxID=2625955 RepID=UPI00157C16AA|nr:hypothetical protein [Methyloligella sp. GL2]QKP78349.1 hypothetical protein HT051_13400 [Methyloligella sp. GL2]